MLNVTTLFPKVLGALLKNMHRGVQHKGKIPRNFKEKQHIKDKLAALQGDLRKAVINENFETAASLRDQIRALEAQLS
ncbi:MAG: UvrB/UvrC motif-containing protein [Verrucomicrobiia bacterium]